MSLRLQDALEALYGLERRRDKHDLQGTIALLRALGDPHRRFRSVHVAGTNGKGSVCALIERVLREAGHRTGLYTSPHLVDFRERIRVDGRWADEAWLERKLEHIESLPEGKDRTFFEVVTALAFEYFAEQNVEIAVVEVGLGGRLDCTNVITPEVSVITSIGLDHTEILGNTIEKIAAEKAGIIKPGAPVVIGPLPDEALAVVEAVAREQAAPIVGVERDSFERPGMPSRPRRPMLGINHLTAAATLETLRRLGIALPGDSLAALGATRWPGRLEACPTEPRLWWDGAHNEAGIRMLADLWDRTGLEARPSVIVLALSSDKDAGAMLRALRAGFPYSGMIATRNRSERALTPVRLAELAKAAGFEVESLPDVPIAVRHALERTTTGIVLLTGSLFAVGEAMETFGGAPGEML